MLRGGGGVGPFSLGSESQTIIVRLYVVYGSQITTVEMDEGLELFKKEAESSEGCIYIYDGGRFSCLRFSGQTH